MTADLTPAQQAKIRVFELDRPEDTLSWEWAAIELHRDSCDCGGYTWADARTARGEL